MNPLWTLALIALLVYGCGGKHGNDPASHPKRPDYVLGIGPPMRYDGYPHQALYRTYILRNVGSAIPADPLVTIHFRFLFRGALSEEYDATFVTASIAGDSYAFTLLKPFPDMNFDAADWTVESTIDPAAAVSDGNRGNNTRTDQLLAYPGDPGVPDDGIHPHDIWAVPDNDTPHPPVYGGSIAWFRVFAYGPIVPINAFVRIRATCYVDGVAQPAYEFYLMNTYYDLQHDGISCGIPNYPDISASGYLKVEVDCDDQYSEGDETNNTTIVPFLSAPFPASNG